MFGLFTSRHNLVESTLCPSCGDGSQSLSQHGLISHDERSYRYTGWYQPSTVVPPSTPPIVVGVVPPASPQWITVTGNDPAPSGFLVGGVLVDTSLLSVPLSEYKKRDIDLRILKHHPALLKYAYRASGIIFAHIPHCCEATVRQIIREWHTAFAKVAPKGVAITLLTAYTQVTKDDVDQQTATGRVQRYLEYQADLLYPPSTDVALPAAYLY